MKKSIAIVLLAGAFTSALAQRTPPRPHDHPMPPHHHHDRGDLPAPPDAPPRPLTPKEVWQKMKGGKKKADAQRQRDMNEMDRNRKNR